MLFKPLSSQTHSRRDKGIALVAILTILVALTGLTALLLQKTQLGTVLSGHFYGQASRRLDAQTGLERAIDDIRERMTNIHDDAYRKVGMTPLTTEFYDKQYGQIAGLQFYLQDLLLAFNPDSTDCTVDENQDPHPNCLARNTKDPTYLITLENRDLLDTEACRGIDATTANPDAFLALSGDPNTAIAGSQTAGCQARLLRFKLGNDSEPELGLELKLKSQGKDKAGREVTVRQRALIGFIRGNAFEKGTLGGQAVSVNNFLGGYIRGAVVHFPDLNRIPAYKATTAPLDTHLDYPSLFDLGIKGEIWLREGVNTGRFDGNYRGESMDWSGSKRIRGQVGTLVTNVRVADELDSDNPLGLPEMATNFTIEDGPYEERTDPTVLPTELPLVMGRADSETGTAMTYQAMVDEFVAPGDGITEGCGGSLLLQEQAALQDTFLLNTPGSFVSDAGANVGDSLIIGATECGAGAPEWNINGNVVVDGDVIIKGEFSGSGSILASGNIYVVGDVRDVTGGAGGTNLSNVGLSNLANGRHASQTDPNDSYYSLEAHCGVPSQCGQLQLISNQNIIVGNLANAHAYSFLATEANKEANYFGVPISPSDGLPAGVDRGPCGGNDGTLCDSSTYTPDRYQVGVKKCQDAEAIGSSCHPSTPEKLTTGGFLPRVRDTGTIGDFLDESLGFVLHALFKFSYVKPQDFSEKALPVMVDPITSGVFKQAKIEGWGFVRDSGDFGSKDGLGRSDPDHPGVSRDAVPDGQFSGEEHNSLYGHGLSFQGNWISSKEFWGLATNAADAENPYTACTAYPAASFLHGVCSAPAVLAGDSKVAFDAQYVSCKDTLPAGLPDGLCDDIANTCVDILPGPPDGVCDNGSGVMTPDDDPRVISQVDTIHATLYGMGYVAGIGGDLLLRDNGTGYHSNALTNYTLSSSCFRQDNDRTFGGDGGADCFDFEKFEDDPDASAIDHSRGLTIVGGVFGSYVNLLTSGGLFVYRDDRRNLLGVDSQRFVLVDSYQEGAE